VLVFGHDEYSIGIGRVLLIHSPLSPETLPKRNTSA
jgi:hypothetical protein